MIKVERPAGDFARRCDADLNGESAYFVRLNRGKQSIALDLRDADDHARLGRMLARADVFIQNLEPGKVEALGFDPARLRAENPRLVTCSISGYGEEARDAVVACSAASSARPRSRGWRRRESPTGG